MKPLAFVTAILITVAAWAFFFWLGWDITSDPEWDTMSKDERGNLSMVILLALVAAVACTVWLIKLVNKVLK